MILQEDVWNAFDIIILLFVLSSCLCAPIARAVQARRMQRANMATQQMRANQGLEEDYVRTPHLGGVTSEIPAVQDKNLQLWEEMLLTTKDHGQKLDAIAKLGRLGTKETLDMLSEYAENDRDPEILAAIESALEQIEQRQIERRIRGEIEGSA